MDCTTERTIPCEYRGIRFAIISEDQARLHRAVGQVQPIVSTPERNAMFMVLDAIDALLDQTAETPVAS